MNINKFKEKHSDLIKFFQIIEGDIKLIFAIMSKGDLDYNYSQIENLTLGQIVNELETLDKSEGEQYFSNSDYKLLKEVTKKRNYCCHFCYRDFVYVNNWEYSNEYAIVCKELQNDWNTLSVIYKKVEEARIKANKLYGRI